MNEKVINIKVKCYSEYKANEKPYSISFDNNELKIKKIIDQWYGPDYLYFKLEAEDENMYIIRYNEKNDNWELIFYKNKLII